MSTPISSIDLGVRVKNCMKIFGIETLEDAASKTDRELLRLPNFGKRSLFILRRAIRNHGLKPVEARRIDYIRADVIEAARLLNRAVNDLQLLIPGEEQK